MTDAELPEPRNLTDEEVLAISDKIMEEIQDDIDAGIMPADVDNFSRLHDYVDANMYGYPLIPDSPGEEWITNIVRVQDEVDRRLRERATKGRKTRVAIRFALVIDNDAWALEYAVPLSEVQQDVITYYGIDALRALADQHAFGPLVTSENVTDIVVTAEPESVYRELH